MVEIDADEIRPPGDDEAQPVRGSILRMELERTLERDAAGQRVDAHETPAYGAHRELGRTTVTFAEPPTNPALHLDEHGGKIGAELVLATR